MSFICICPCCGPGSGAGDGAALDKSAGRRVSRARREVLGETIASKVPRIWRVISLKRCPPVLRILICDVDLILYLTRRAKI